MTKKLTCRDPKKGPVHRRKQLPSRDKKSWSNSVSTAKERLIEDITSTFAGYFNEAYLLVVGTDG
jgi:hypothetical protein